MQGVFNTVSHPSSPGLSMGDNSSSTSEKGASDQTAFTPAQRVAELNEIDRSLTTLLASASEAVGVLANARNGNAIASKYEAQEKIFQRASSTYFATLSSIEVGLKRQVYALEEAGLIQPGEERDAKKGKAVLERPVTGAGVGQLDSSWLNAMANNGVQDGLQREILKEAKEFLSAAKGGNGTESFGS